MFRASTLSRPLSRALSQPVSRARRGLLPRLLDLFALRRQRSHLGRLPPHLLRDIGLTEEEARTEADRPLWDAPSHWRR